MKLRLLLPVLAAFTLGGCIIVRDTTVVKPAKSKTRKDCHPSEYWDGSQCRHKGKGHGARKHDH
ncbi:hypothetical protein [Hyalangium gracile]|uniref:hypothetical protein n=1 Tax=Hyalangium gracile TaxID=394092 RepID=UPI001CCC164A|nr:hypothetical protein [Hyalangium gracile]